MQEKKQQNHLYGDFLTAVSFLTIIPIRVNLSEHKDALARAMFFFPLVGFGIATISFGASSAFESFLSPRITNLLLVLFPMLLSGCLHVDGFADFFDAFFQKKDREEILKVMKDPHIGVWGTVSVVFCILLKWECLMILPFQGKSFLVALTLSRWSHVFLSYLQPYAGQQGGLGELVAKRIGVRELAGASVFALLIAAILGWQGIGVFVVIILFILCLGHFYRQRLGGITGDLIGATGEMTEIVVYILILLFMHVATIL